MSYVPYTHNVFIKLGSYNTIVCPVPQALYTSGVGLNIESYYSNENNFSFETKFYKTNSSNALFKKNLDDYSTVEEFISKDKVLDWENTKVFIELALEEIKQKIMEKDTLNNVSLSLSIITSVNPYHLQKLGQLMNHFDFISNVKFIPIYLSLLYNYPMGNYGKNASPDMLSVNDEEYKLAGGLGKFYEEYIINSDLTTSTIPSADPVRNILNSNVMTNQLLMQDIQLLSGFYTNTGFQGHSLIVDIGYKQTKVYFVKNFKNDLDLETTIDIGCKDFIDDILKQNPSVSDIDYLLEHGWVNFEISDNFTEFIKTQRSVIKDTLNLNTIDANIEDQEEELDVAKILASGEPGEKPKNNEDESEEKIEGQNVDYKIQINDSIHELIMKVSEIANIQGNNEFNNMLTFGKMLENIVLSGSLTRSKSFKDSLLKIMSFEFNVDVQKSDNDVNPTYNKIKAVNPAIYFPNWKEDPSQEIDVFKKHFTKNTFDSDIKGALIASRYGFTQLISYPASRDQNTNYGYSIHEGILVVDK
ncbi:unnamed protein product [Hanseniaspora opuntiae]